MVHAPPLNVWAGLSLSLDYNYVFWFGSQVKSFLRWSLECNDATLHQTQTIICASERGCVCASSIEPASVQVNRKGLNPGGRSINEGVLLSFLQLVRPAIWVSQIMYTCTWGGGVSQVIMLTCLHANLCFEILTRKLIWGSCFTRVMYLLGTEISIWRKAQGVPS